jgi:choline dehydrogenase
MIYMRGQARDYNHWAAVTGDDEWSWEHSLRDFMRHEDHYRLDANRSAALGANQNDFKTYHRSGGEWRVEKQRLRWEILDAFADAAQQAGLPARDDFNQGDNEGVSYFEVNQRNGWRWNTSKAFLRPARGRQNLTIWTRAQVKRLLIETAADGTRHCRGAELLRDGHTVLVKAAREVVLSAGAIGTPHILQLSGIGPGAVLQKHGVRVIHDAPGVGANLQDHLQIRASFKVQGAATLNTIAGSFWGKARIGMEYLLRRTGPMSMAPSQLGAFTRSDPQRAHPNIQFHVQPLSLEAFGQPLHPYPAITVSVANLNPSSRGTVALKHADFGQAPAIAPNYLTTPDDRKVAADSIRIARFIVNQPALARYKPEEVSPGIRFQSDEELALLAGDIGTTIFHPVGTAKMGKATDRYAVVDHHLRVFGIAGLRVVDASVMPAITSGNTNSPTLMIAEKAARWIISGC